jgi:hypothetical protein
MFEGLFSPLHLLTLLFVALIVFGIPLLLIFLLADGWTNVCNVDRV